MKKLIEEIKIFINTHYKNYNSRSKAIDALKRIENLEKIDIESINKLYSSIPTSKLSNSSKMTEISYIKNFLNKVGNFKRRVFKVDDLLKLPSDTIPKETFDLIELENIQNYLKLFKNEQFRLIFNLLLFNGCRLAEFCSTDWKSMKINKYQMRIKAKKHGNFRIMTVPDHLIDDFERIGISYSYNTIQNLFNEFSKFVKFIDPNFRKRISAHVLRAQMITHLHLAGMSSGEIQNVTGHSNSNTIERIYIKTSDSYKRQIMELAAMNPIESMEINKLHEFINYQNKQIIESKNQINLLKLRLDEEQNNENKDTNLQEVENKPKILLN
ncbi:site-specific integrase [Metamycoplasma hyosynoviae]|uniref:tyrosine-type recombinase/integrase n=1 Tax=Metamycoplasma hyosynoviae TaxID=29559 RepID=UPI00235950EA|nr:site-specific integrase [Metamycoplasma hyosynoviae]MDC8900391.1 site-specific integrase [Metamycoplasma hyosynoviae]MDD7837650.1 site-specific integrase [Metamycoplasma hyosynoviae]